MVKKRATATRGCAPYFAIPFAAQRFGRIRRGTDGMTHQAPLPGPIWASNTWQARASRFAHRTRLGGWPPGWGTCAPAWWHLRAPGGTCEKQSINFALACWRLRAHGQWTPPQAYRTYLVGGGRGGYHRRHQQEDAQGPRHGRGCGDCKGNKGLAGRNIKKKQGVCVTRSTSCILVV